MGSKTEEDGFNLCCKFIDDSESFVLGFECGLIWAHLANKTQYSFTAHRKNIEQLGLMANYFECNLRVDEACEAADDQSNQLINDEWCLIDFNPIIKPHKKSYLKVIK
jgi:hypothetical protein